MSRIVFDDEYVIVMPSFKEVLPHKHSFYHVFWVGGDAEQLYVVGGNMRHVMPPLPQCKLFLMIDPTSCMAERIDGLLESGKPKTIDLLNGLDVTQCSDDELKQRVRDCLIANGLLETTKNDIDSEDYRVVRLLKELKAYKHLEKSIQEIADQYGLSDSRLSHVFKECMGVSLKGYLNIKQMQYAYKLIMDGESITYAALEAGFSSPAHLAAICKKQMGISISMVLR
ncbi:MAG: AraC family transcriptional regulator [Eubacteriales bacterium]|nr:AraC family transcriptional regulator [Eubacteriales bacterium]